MRHAGLAVAAAVRSLSASMSNLACFCGLVTAACRPQLLLPPSLPADFAAIPLSAVAGVTDREKSVASGIAAPLQAEAILAFITCHRPPQYDIRMIGRMTRAFGADDVAGAFYAGQKLKKLRFLMTDNKLASRSARAAMARASDPSRRV